MKIKSILLVFAVICFSQILFGQNEPGKEEKQTLTKKNLPPSLFSKQDILNAGLHISDQSLPLSNFDISLILNFDFNPYRDYNSRRKVQIEKGPLIELFSLQEMISKGKAIDPELIKNKKNPDTSNMKHDLVVLVKVGLGVSNAVEPK